MTSARTVQSEKLLVIVPFRDREAHRQVFVPYATRTLAEQNISFKLVFVEQSGTAPFNRGLLANVGFDLYGREYDYLCIHDVDVIGENFDYSFAPLVTHLSARQRDRNYTEWYPRCIGGVTLFPTAAFAAANGFSGSYWGWGGEDDDLRIRLDLANMPVQRRQGRYHTLRHATRSTSDSAHINAQRLADFAHSHPHQRHQRVIADGLSNVKQRYKTLAISESECFTNVRVSFAATVCLSMIVKNEAAIIMDCLTSVASHIDYWVVVDTGSTDGTQDTVRKFFAALDIPGELHERPWVDFGTNRTEALKLCDGKADYAWVIDADDRVIGAFAWPEYKNLYHDAYAVHRGDSGGRLWGRQVFKTGIGWHYRDVLHEYAYREGPSTLGRIDGDYYVEMRTIGCRSAGVTTHEKYMRDAEILLAELEKEPEHERYQFYLGQSYFAAGEYDLAFTALGKRVTQGGWPEERYQAFMLMATIARERKMAPEVYQSLLLRAWNASPIRAEPLVALSKHFRARKELCAAYLFARQAAQLSYPADAVTFVDAEVYEWQAADELAVTAHAVGDHRTGLRMCERLLKGAKLPLGERDRVTRNYKAYIDVVYGGSGEQAAGAEPGPAS